VDIQGGTGIATLGLSVAVTNGTNTNPGTSNLLIQRPVVASSSNSQGVLAYFLATVNTSAIYLTNNNSTTAANLRVMVAGDIVSTP
jgi:hypothetical protein